MACRTRQDVINVLAELEEKLFTETQRGAFNTNAHPHERELIKGIIRQCRITRMVLAPKQQSCVDVNEGLVAPGRKPRFVTGDPAVWD